MKRMITLFLVAAFICTITVASAEDLGVQIIGGNDKTSEILNLEDVVLGESYTIEGYARIKPCSFAFVNEFLYYAEGHVGDNSTVRYDQGTGVVYKADTSSSWGSRYANIYWQQSGENAEYAWFLVDITNLQKKSVAFMADSSVKVTFDDEYEFKGWLRQLNYDYDSYREFEGDTGYGKLIRPTISGKEEEPIDMMYTGHYVIGCTLPNEVVNGKEPLRITLTINGSEVTYNIRK